jgi:hypothetical protein
MQDSVQRGNLGPPVQRQYQAYHLGRTVRGYEVREPGLMFRGE